MPSLSDNQLDLLKSFLTALSQQPQGFKEFQAQLPQIAQNLVVGVERLDELANL
ncbi:MAG: hypothetical protein F6K03_14060, partial [Kamptonema sp. SIO4C4]|nr:hypothetical protein [Kamptonema sp. SIO4C4]